MRLVLWDIDGTLIRGGSYAGEVFGTAIEQVVGRNPGMHGVAMSGKTDPQIAAEILAGMGVAADGHLPAILERIEVELAAGAARLRSGGRVLPGVEALLARLDTEDGLVQTVLTGNIAPNAALKLAAFGLDHWFDLTLGAYGSDHHDRRELVPFALRRVGDHYGDAPEVTWVVGDTANDLACARAAGVRCLLVGTGRFPAGELAQLGADAVLHDLSDIDQVVRILVGT